ncbi:MAG: hypothetical protein HFF62_00010 [Oscillospiraceae bacterium]|jgi:hypothetical protein|nr:hypothetical protein [Oscillospiraceae bacterium]
MAERIAPGPVSNIKDCEAVCIHTKKIYDSCRDKDCIEDLRFYPTACGQDVLNRAQTVKGGKAELLYTYINVEPVVFNRGFYTIDMRFFYRVTLNAYCANPRPIEVEGLCVFDKRVILFGSEGSAKIFSSKVRIDGLDRQLLEQSNMPIAVVEAVDPIVLDAKLVECCENRCCDCDICEIPPCICQCFGCDLTMGDDYRRAFVTLGQFSIIRLERDSQLLMPVFDYCMPDKDCNSGAGCGCGCCCGCEDPCDLFQNIKFPVNQFFPPNSLSNPRDYECTKQYCNNCRN